MTTDPAVPEGPLLRALASSSLSRRRAAMAQLRAFLASKNSFSRTDHLKLWKGLFYCLYMTPKMLHQQRLSIEISELVYALADMRGEGSSRKGEAGKAETTAAAAAQTGAKRRRRDEAEVPVGQRGEKRRRVSGSAEVGEEEGKFLGFIRAFWVTIGREWEGIDKARLDKFLFLVRRMVFVGFEGCKMRPEPAGSVGKGGAGNEEKKSEEDAEDDEDAEDAEDAEEEYTWDETLLDGYVAILQELPLNAKDVKMAVGLKLHVIDVLVDEMERADTLRTLDTGKLTQLLQVLAKESMTKTVRKRAQEELEDERLKEWSNKGEKVANGADADADAGEESSEEDPTASADQEEEFGGFDD